MELQDYLRVIRNHWWVIGLAVALGGALAYGYTSLQPKVYTATGSAIIVTASAESLGDKSIADAYAQSRVLSYLDVAKSRQVANYAAEQLDLDVSPDALIARVSISNPDDTAVLRVAASGSSPQDAQQLAEAWIYGMTQMVEELENPDGLSNSALSLRTLDSALLPGGPSSPNVRLNVSMGLLLGGAAGVAFALVRAAVDRRIRTTASVEQHFDVPVLGVVPFDNAVAKKGIARGERDFHTVEAVRQLRTNLQFMDIDNPPRIIVVTSAEAGEGKSTISIALAEAIAESGRTVVLIDADLRRPSVVKYLGLVRGAGLTDVLVGRVPPEAALQSWGSTGRMAVMGAGSIPPNPSELLGSDTMRQLLERIDPTAVILLDSPPLLPVTDAAILAARTDGAVVVTRAGKTTIDRLDQALVNLERVKGRALGIIIDGVSRKSDSARYSSKYRYEAGADEKSPMPWM